MRAPALPLCLAATLAPALAAPVPAQSPQRLFDAPILVPGFAPPGQVEDMDLLGDVDNDGDVDILAFTRDANGSVRYSFRPLRNDGLGNLTAGAAVPIPPSGGAHVCTADVDGDGFLDVVTSVSQHAAGFGVFVFRNLAGTGWAPPVHVPLPFHPMRLTPGRANADTAGDLFVLYAIPVGTSALFDAQWVLGSPTLACTLGPGTTFGTQSVGSGAVVDVDGDGLDDFAALVDTGPGQHVELHRTTPVGLVLHGTLPLTTSGNAQLQAADMDGDKDRDLIAMWGQVSATRFRVLRNDSAGWIADPVQTVTMPGAHALRTVDWDGDGDRDLLARDGGVFSPPYDVTLLENVAGVFAVRRRDTFPELTFGVGAGTADLDGDGHADYVEPHALVFGTGTFTLPTAVLEFPGDWDGDGDLDEVERTLAINDGRGVLSNVPGFLPTPPVNHLYGPPAVTADFDGDGKRDALVPLHGGLYSGFVEMRRLEANGDGVLVDVGTAASTQINPGDLPDDVDDDGDVDVLGFSGVWRNNGSGVFTLVPFGVAGFAPMAKADLDGDGDQDFVGSVGPQALLLHRTAPGTFAAAQLTPLPHALAGGVSVVDLDDDGDRDIVGAAYSLVFLNTNGAFVQGPSLLVGGKLCTGDLDGDGTTDVAIQTPDFVHVLRRIGPGLTYAPPVSYIWRAAKSAADLDQDGDVDLLGASTLWNRRFAGPTAGYRRQYGRGSAGSDGRRPILSLLGPLRAGLTTSVRVASGYGGSVGALFVGGGEANLPGVLPGITGYTSLPILSLGAPLGGPFGQPGAGSVEIPITIPAAAHGARLFLQFLLLDPAAPIGITHTNGCELFVGM